MRRDRDLVIVPLYGGLGNQLFGCAFGAYIESKFGVSTLLRLARQGGGNENHGQNALNAFSFSPSPRFDLETRAQAAARRVGRLLGTAKGKHVTVAGVTYKVATDEPDKDVRELLGDGAETIHLSGYFRSRQFLDSLQSQKKFQSLDLKPPKTRVMTLLESQIHSSDAVVVHMRRGDYLKRSIRGALSPSYFKEAIFAVGAGFRTPIIVLSDSPHLAHHELDVIGFRELHTPGYNLANLEPPEALVLASQARKLVMSNSTFSWWAARVGNTEKTVAYPAGWDDKLSHNDWIAVRANG